jgi:hypothetical protein
MVVNMVDDSSQRDLRSLNVDIADLFGGTHDGVETMTGAPVVPAGDPELGTSSSPPQGHA